MKTMATKQTETDAKLESEDWTRPAGDVILGVCDVEEAVSCNWEPTGREAWEYTPTWLWLLTIGLIFIPPLTPFGIFLAVFMFFGAKKELREQHMAKVHGVPPE